MKNTYCKQIVVNRIESDINSRWKLSYLLRQAQQIATDHCDSLGMTQELYDKTHTAFVLARISLEIKEEMRCEDIIEMRTTPSEFKRAMSLRYTQFFNTAGTECASVDSRWILIDTDSKRILRTLPEAFCFPFLEAPKAQHKMSMPKNLPVEYVKTVSADYSVCDLNYHVNNAVYADFICDCLPLELMKEKMPKKLVIFYHNELSLQKKADLYMGKIDENTFYILGKNAEKKFFEATITF